MPEIKPTPTQTLAVVLGASSFRRAPKLAQGRVFYNSAQDFHEYLVTSDGLGLPQKNVNWLFDDSRSPGDQLHDMGDFLEERSNDLRNQKSPPQDLIVCYVGHGLFWGADQAYCLAVRATDERNEGFTSIRVSDLASIIKTHARFLRKFLILDCCFSAAAYKEFQSGPLHTSRVKILDELPQRGTTLLCSASAQAPSSAAGQHSRTMFSDALLRALRRGHPLLGPRLSLNELGDLINLDLRETYPDTWVRPEVHSPDQGEGDVASVGIFPNVAYSSTVRNMQQSATNAHFQNHNNSLKQTENRPNQIRQQPDSQAQNVIHVTPFGQQELPLDICIETLGGIATPVIPRNTMIPTHKSEVFSTATDNQTSVEVHLLIGNRPLAQDNRTLGKFHLTGIPLAARGVPQIEVKFDIDSDGVLKVTAKDKATGKDQRITITSSGLSQEQVEKMSKEADAYAIEDEAKRQEIESRLRLDSVIYNIENMLKEHVLNLSSEDKNKLEAGLRDGKQASLSKDVAVMNSAHDKLTALSHKLAEIAYKNSKVNERSSFTDVFNDFFGKK